MNIVDLLNRRDIQQHMLGGVIIAMMLYTIELFDLAWQWRVFIEGSLAVWGWEFLQWYRKEGQPDPWDAIAGQVGLAVVVGAFDICYYLMSKDL